MLALLALAPGACLAARAWLLPSQTIVARAGGWVTFDAANSDDLFSFNQGAMPVDQLSVTGPDGNAVAAQNIAKGKTRSSFDLELRAPGTYRVAVAGDTVMARWEEEGKPKRWRGTAAEMAANIPANAAKLEVEQMQRRVETFVTVGTPTGAQGKRRGPGARADHASERSLCGRGGEVPLPARRQAGQGSRGGNHRRRHALPRRAATR